MCLNRAHRHSVFVNQRASIRTKSGSPQLVQPCMKLEILPGHSFGAVEAQDRSFLAYFARYSDVVKGIKNTNHIQSSMRPCAIANYRC
jgi:hypothetical protein